MKSKGIRVAVFFLIFGLSKFCVFLGPLLLANQLSIKEYGLVEYTLALGSIIAIFFNSGVSASYPYFILRRKLNSFKPYFLLHPLMVSLIAVLAGILFITGILDSRYFLGLLIGAVTANQILVSTKQKSHERGNMAVLVESGVFILLTVIALLMMSGVLKDITWFYGSVFAYYLIFLAHSAISLKELKVGPSTLMRYKKIIQYGLPIVFSSVAVVLFSTSGRIIVEWFLEIDKVGIYAFYFRIASVVIVIYQIINVLFFKKIYTYPFRILDKYFSKFFIGILTVGLIFYFFIQLFEQEIFSILKTNVREEGSRKKTFI